MEQTLLDTIRLFNFEAQCLRNHVPGTGINFELEYDYASYNDKAEIKFSCSFKAARGYESVEAASLKEMMDEVYRRLGFGDKQALAFDAVERGLKAIEGSKESSNRSQREDWRPGAA